MVDKELKRKSSPEPTDEHQTTRPKQLRQTTIDETLFKRAPPRAGIVVTTTTVSNADEIAQWKQQTMMNRSFAVVAGPSTPSSRAAENERMMQTIKAVKTGTKRVSIDGGAFDKTTSGGESSKSSSTRQNNDHVNRTISDSPSMAMDMDMDAMRDFNDPLPDLNDIDNSTGSVLFSVQSLSSTNLPRPFPPQPSDPSMGWNLGKAAVRMPFSSQNPKSDAIRKALTAISTPLSSIKALETAILSYNESRRGVWRFDALNRFFDEFLDAEMAQNYLNVVIPGMAKLALDLQMLITQPLMILRAGRSGSVTMSQQQCASLLANAFFCTFPCRGQNGPDNLPGINFNRLFSGAHRLKMQKLRCIFSYFDQILQTMPTGVISIRRVCCRDFPDWSTQRMQLTDLIVSSKGKIEDDGGGMLEVDFANCYIGGGVLGEGNVQEEIRFLIYPEMIVSCLITERMNDNEAIRIVGAQRFSDYLGYGSSFTWQQRSAQVNVKNAINVKNAKLHVELVAIDAIPHPNGNAQFTQKLIVRELNKAYAGFLNEQKRPKGIATGNWGCGVFGGDVHLKSLLQLMAASVCGRPLAYFTFGNEKLAEQLMSIHALLRQRKCSVGDIFDMFERYSIEKSTSNDGSALWDFIRKQLQIEDKSSL